MDKPDTQSNQFKLYAGAAVDDNGQVKFHWGHPQVTFNWSSDSPSDIVPLCSDTSGEFEIGGVRFVYAYDFAADARRTDERIFKKFIKGLPDCEARYSADVSEFVERAVLRLDKRYPLDSFGATVYIGSSAKPSFVDVMHGQLRKHIKMLTYPLNWRKKTILT